MTRFLARHAEAVAASAVALVVVGPLLAPGFLLAYDMVFVPHPWFTRALLGLGPALPRSVPNQLLVTVLSRAIGGEVVEKVALLGIFFGAALGAARLTPSRSAAGRIAAGVLYAWNPFTYERLLLGQWALLLGYALLAWAVGAAVRLRRGERGAWRGVALSLAATAAASPYAGVIAAATVMLVVGCPPWKAGEASGRPIPQSGRRLFAASGIALAVNLFWLVPALLHPAFPERPALATFLFRPRADSPFGTLGSLLSLGGLWRNDLAPPGRSTGAWLPAFLIIAGAAGVGWRALRRRWPDGADWGLLVAAGLGLALAAGPIVPGFRAVTDWIGRASLLGGFLRDSQKFVIPFALLLSVGFGLGVETLLATARGAGGGMARPAAAVFALLPVALAPTLAWGGAGRLHTASYPPSWARAESIMERDPQSGGVLVLPWHAYLPFRWNGERTVHQAAPLYFRRSVLVASSLQAGPYELPAEDPWSRRASPSVEAAGPLTNTLPGLGIRYVVVFKEADWRTFPPRLQGLQVALDSPDLRLYRAPTPAAVPKFAGAPVAPVVVMDVGGLLLILTAVASAVAETARQVRRPGWRRVRRPG